METYIRILNSRINLIRTSNHSVNHHSSHLYCNHNLNDDIREEVDNQDNLETLWKRLDKKYGNSGKLIDTILENLTRIPKGDEESTIQMIKTVEKAYRDLSRMGRATEMENGTILSIIEKNYQMKFASNGSRLSQSMMKMRTQARNLIESLNCCKIGRSHLSIIML